MNIPGTSQVSPEDFQECSRPLRVYEFCPSDIGIAEFGDPLYIVDLKQGPVVKIATLFKILSIAISLSLSPMSILRSK